MTTTNRPDYFGEMRAARPRCNVEFEARKDAIAAGLSVERYKSRPDNAPTSPPGTLGTWPTGFAGTGWVVRDSAGAILYAHAFRAECLAFVRQAAVAMAAAAPR